MAEVPDKHDGLLLRGREVVLWLGLEAVPSAFNPMAAAGHLATDKVRWVGEPIFVPRAPDAEEDDGFVLSLLHDATEDRSAIDILDARAIDAEPVARLWLDERVPLGFHGNWLQA